MFDWWGNRKIGIIGAANSGKTMLLTSLLWHMDDHNPALKQFNLNHDGRIQDFREIARKEHNFDFERHRNTLRREFRWPEKTMDYAIAECKYKMPGHTCERHVTFVDIPGERISDILIWQAKNYRDWVERLRKFWHESPENERVMMCYWNSALKKESSLEKLNKKYKLALCLLLHYKFCPVTPSTYLLGTDGSMLGDKNNAVHMHGARRKTIFKRPLWNCGELLPLPEEWCNAHPKEYRDMEKIFHNYRKMVLKPLFREIDDCYNFIFCVNIFDILNDGPLSLDYYRNVFKALIDEVKPGKFMRGFNKIGRNPPRVAYVATQSDRVSDKKRLENLLSLFANPLRNKGIGITDIILTCYACRSSKKQGEILMGKDCDNPDQPKPLPDNLPNDWSDWNPKDYNFWEIAPQIDKNQPPKQYHLDSLLEFIVEGEEVEEEEKGRAR